MAKQNESALKQMIENLNETEHMTEKQIQILKAAIELISEKGYYATSTSEIAKRAGVAEGTIFRHYRTKKDLLVAILKPGITQLAAPFFAEQFIDDVFNETYANVDEILHAFIKNRFEFAQSNVPLLKIVLQELAFHPDIQAAYKKAFIEKVYPTLNRALDYYKEKGQLKDIPNDSIIRMMVSTIIGFIINRFLIQPEKDWDDALEIERTTAYILNGIGKNR